MDKSTAPVFLIENGETGWIIHGISGRLAGKIIPVMAQVDQTGRGNSKDAEQQHSTEFFHC